MLQMMPAVLGVIAAMPETVERGTQQLATAKDAIDAPGRGPAEEPCQQDHVAQAEAKAKEGCYDNEHQGLRDPLHTSAPSPAFANPAPTSPPTSAWDELEGKPTRQVMRFQTIAPVNAAQMIQ